MIDSLETHEKAMEPQRLIFFGRDTIIVKINKFITNNDFRLDDNTKILDIIFFVLSQ